MPRTRCAYDVAGISTAAERFCPSCGVLVNRSIRPKRCSADAHAQRRRARSTYCVDCGERLAVGG